MAKWYGPSSGACSCLCEPPGLCWDCATPVAITVAELSPPAGDGCASFFDGTYFFNQTICQLNYSFPRTIFFDMCSPLSPGVQSKAAYAVCQYNEDSEIVSGSDSIGPYEDHISYWWTIPNTVTMVAAYPITGPRRMYAFINRPIRLYEQILRHQDVGPPSGFSIRCIANGIGDSNLIAEVSVLDVYELAVVNCGDVVDDIKIPHISRTITTVTDPGLTILGNLIAYNTTAYTVPDPCEVRLQI